MKEQERTELVVYRIKRATSTLEEVSLHLENNLLNTAVNRIYYACYYAVIALLMKQKINAQTHSGVRQMFGLHYVKTGIIDKELGRFYTDIFDKRQTGDYDDFVEFEKDEVLELYDSSKRFVQAVEKLLYRIP